MRNLLIIGLILLTSLSVFGQTNSRQSAVEFNIKLGRGVNYMGSKINAGYHHPYDFELIANNKFTHVRLGSRLWQYVGSAPNYTIDANKLASYKSAVDWALNENLMVIVDAIHAWDNYNDADSAKLYKLWEQLATTFASYPKDKVAFEIMNEPRNNNLNLESMIKGSLQRIRSTAGNEERIVIVSGQGFPTRTALIDALDNNIYPSNDDYLIATFHYYDPKTFTKQGHFNNGIVYWADGGDNDVEWTETLSKFQAVVTADSNWAVAHNTTPLPVYMGEYGVDNAAPNADRVRWLWWIRTVSEQFHFSHAIWNLYNNAPNAKGIGPWTSVEKNNPLMRTLDQSVLEPYRNRYEFEDNVGNFQYFVINNDTTASNDSLVFMLNLVNNTQDSIIGFRNIYIPKSGYYDITMRYMLDGDNGNDPKIYLNLKTFNSNGQFTDSIRNIHLLRSGYITANPPDGLAWAVQSFHLHFEAGDSNTFIIGFQPNTEPFVFIYMDYISITKGVYYDNLYPTNAYTMSIAEPQFINSNIKLFPNPANNTVHISGKFEKWKLFSIDGKCLESGRQKSINVQSYHAGLYILRVDKHATRLIIK